MHFLYPQLVTKHVPHDYLPHIPFCLRRKSKLPLALSFTCQKALLFSNCFYLMNIKLSPNMSLKQYISSTHGLFPSIYYVATCAMPFLCRKSITTGYLMRAHSQGSLEEFPAIACCWEGHGPLLPLASKLN